MANYYYSKYAVTKVYESYLYSQTFYSSQQTFTMYSGFTFSTITGLFSYREPLASATPDALGASVYGICGEGCMMNIYYVEPGEATTITWKSRVKSSSKGTFIETIISQEGIYPDDGIQGDYWYVKGEKAFPDMKVNVGGAWKDAVEGWVNIGGVWKEISDIKQNIGGIWK